MSTRSARASRCSGNLLKKLNVKRENVVVATKVFQQMSDDPNDRGLSRKHIMDSIDKSLKRLQMDYVDLYQIHRWDYSTPIEETMDALNDVVRAGKARYIGASSMFAWQFAKAQHTAELHGWTRFVSMQNHYNLVYREEEREMIPLVHRPGCGIDPLEPDGARILRGRPQTRRRRRDHPRQGGSLSPISSTSANEDFTVADRAREIAREHNVTGSQVALAWLLNKPHITSPIIGASKMDHLEQAIAALEIKLSAEEIKHLEEPYQPHPVLGHS